MSVNFAWSADSVTSDPNTNTVGYNVHIGTASGQYTITVNAENITHVTVSNLTASQKYFAVVKAYNEAGSESGASNEVSFTMPGPTPSVITIGAAVVYPTVDTHHGGYLVAQKANLTQSATLTSLSFYVSAAAGTLLLAIYSGANRPTTLIASTPIFNAALGWNTQKVTPILLLPGTYWIVYLPSSDALAFAVNNTAGTAFFNAAATVPNTFPTSATYAQRQWSFYATLTPTTAPPTYNAWVASLNNEIATGVTPVQLSAWITAHPPTAD
jgi:Fibronectin type III domain